MFRTAKNMNGLENKAKALKKATIDIFNVLYSLQLCAIYCSSRNLPVGMKEKKFPRCKFLFCSVREVFELPNFHYLLYVCTKIV